MEGETPPIRYYREKRLETEVMCSNCALRYAIYGVFAYCLDCGIHNSQQILDKNLELAEKEAALAGTVESELATRLIEDALENEVSSFDGFGRENCEIVRGGYSSGATRRGSVEGEEQLRAVGANAGRGGGAGL